MRNLVLEQLITPALQLILWSEFQGEMSDIMIAHFIEMKSPSLLRNCSLYVTLLILHFIIGVVIPQKSVHWVKVPSEVDCDFFSWMVGACSLVVNSTISNLGGVSSNPSFSIL